MNLLWIALGGISLLWLLPAERAHSRGPLAVGLLLAGAALHQATLPGMNNPDSRSIWWLVLAAAASLFTRLPLQTASMERFAPALRAAQLTAISLALLKLPFPEYGLLPIYVVLILVGLIGITAAGAQNPVWLLPGLLLLWAAAFPFVDRNWQPAHGWLVAGGALALAALSITPLPHDSGEKSTSLRRLIEQSALSVVLAGAIPHFLQFR